MQIECHDVIIRHVKTYPTYAEDGSLRAFEVATRYSRVFRLLKNCDGVTDARRIWFQDARIAFNFRKSPFVALEPFGDNSRLWIGPVEPDLSTVDVAPLLAVFAAHESWLERVCDRISAR